MLIDSFGRGVCLLVEAAALFLDDIKNKFLLSSSLFKSLNGIFKALILQAASAFLLLFIYFLLWLLFSFDNELGCGLWNRNREIKQSGWFAWTWASLISLFAVELAAAGVGFGIHIEHRCTLVAYLCPFSVMEWLPGGCNEREGRERRRLFFSHRCRQRDLMDGGMMAGMTGRGRRRGGMEGKKKQQVKGWRGGGGVWRPWTVSHTHGKWGREQGRSKQTSPWLSHNTADRCFLYEWLASTVYILTACWCVSVCFLAG